MTDIYSITSDALRKKIPTGYLTNFLGETGRQPRVELLIKSITNEDSPGFRLSNFLSYSFSSSILTPVDTFSFQFVAPQDERPTTQFLKSGHLAQLIGNNIPFATGILDTVDVEISSSEGESVNIEGRDLMGQLEDNETVDTDSKAEYGNNYTIRETLSYLTRNTRIPQSFIIRNVADPSRPYLFATEPGETKLSALQRYLEPLNLVAWMSPEGKIIVGKPNFAQESEGKLYILKDSRRSNVLGMKISRSDTLIPNYIVPIWTGQENTVSRASTEQAIKNPLEGPSRLFKAGHKVIKTIVVSNPQATNPQGLAETNRLTAAGSNLLQAYAKRDLARANINALSVQVKVAGHYNENGEPYIVDTCYDIQCDRAEVDERMYLYSVEYTLTEEEGQITFLNFCPLGTIVADAPVVDNA